MPHSRGHCGERGSILAHQEGRVDDRTEGRLRVRRAATPRGVRRGFAVASGEYSSDCRPDADEALSCSPATRLRSTSERISTAPEHRRHRAASHDLPEPDSPRISTSRGRESSSNARPCGCRRAVQLSIRLHRRHLRAHERPVCSIEPDQPSTRRNPRHREPAVEESCGVRDGRPSARTSIYRKAISSVDIDPAERRFELQAIECDEFVAKAGRRCAYAGSP